MKGKDLFLRKFPQTDLYQPIFYKQSNSQR